jgi:hypothetical protein
VDWGQGLPPGAAMFFDVFRAPRAVCDPCEVLSLRLDGMDTGMTGVAFDPGSLPFEARLIRVYAMNGPMVVGSVELSPPYPPHLAFANLGSSGQDGVRIRANQGDLLDPDADGDLLIELQNALITEIALPSPPPLGPILGDRILIVIEPPAGESWPDEVEVAQFRGAGIPQFTVRERFDSKPPLCPEDINNDGDVDVNDLVAVIVAWGTSDAAADVNDDSIVDVNDLVAVITKWGPCLPPAPQKQPKAPKTPKAAAPKGSKGAAAKTGAARR